MTYAVCINGKKKRWMGKFLAPFAANRLLRFMTDIGSDWASRDLDDRLLFTLKQARNECGYSRFVNPMSAKETLISACIDNNCFVSLDYPALRTK